MAEINFCKGCIHWVFCETFPYGFGNGFHYCNRFDEWDKRKRRELCNGKYKKTNNNSKQQ